MPNAKRKVYTMPRLRQQNKGKFTSYEVELHGCKSIKKSRSL